MPALPGSCSLPPCSTGPSANFIIIQNIPKLVVCCWLNGVPSPRLALISVAAYTVLWLWSWGVKIGFWPPAPSFLLTLGVGVSWRQKIIFFWSRIYPVTRSCEWEKAGGDPSGTWARGGLEKPSLWLREYPNHSWQEVFGYRSLLQGPLQEGSKRRACPFPPN